MSVCDAYDAMTSERAYRPGRSHEAVLAKVREQTGLEFAPIEGEAFLGLSDSLFDEVSALHDEGWDPLALER